jgi:hypothetical protein
MNIKMTLRNYSIFYFHLDKERSQSILLQVPTINSTSEKQLITITKILELFFITRFGTDIGIIVC